MVTATYTAKPGSVFVPQKKSLFYKQILAVMIFGPFLGTILAMILLWNRLSGPLDVILLIVFYYPITLGGTGGLHGLFTHLSFVAVPWVRRMVGILALMALEGSIISWTATHREHHLKSDRDGDPHSPKDGYWHSHFWWLFKDTTADPKRFVPDLLADPIVSQLDGQILLWITVSLIGPYLLGGVLGGLWAVTTGLDVLGFAWESAWHAELWAGV